jgi:hypothetical protein
MKKWKAILTNGEEWAETGNVSAWRELSERCKKHQLKIKSLLWNGKEVDDGAKYYFVIYQMNRFTKPNVQTFMIGIGVLKNNKCYIDWYHLPNKQKAFRIVHRDPKEFECYNEIAISRA